jgi:autotransporter-associated beta strand protein
MAEYKFGCPQCGQHILCTDAYIGTQINCPNCQKAIIVTRPKGAAPRPMIQSARVGGSSGPSVLRIAVISAVALGVCLGLTLGGWIYFSQQRAQQKELQQAQAHGRKSATAKARQPKTTANSKDEAAPTQNAVTGGMLTLVGGSTLQFHLDVNAATAPASLSVQSPNLDTLNLDANLLADAATRTVLLTNALKCFGDATINVTGNPNDTLALGAIIGRTSDHIITYTNITINAPAGGPGVSIALFQTGNWGEWLTLRGGGNVTITGNLTNDANGSSIVYVTGGTTATLQGRSVFASSAKQPNAYKYCVADGTLVLDNNDALTNNTTGIGLKQSWFILGAATGAFGKAAPAGVLVATDNSFNAAVYLGDASHATGGLINNDRNTNHVSDGDASFVNSGVFTIGGQNTSGINTYANPVILGLTADKGKSVTLVAATGGEVDFTGGLLANGSDTTAGVTVGDATHGGTVKFTAANTYGGNTFIANGRLALSGSCSIANSANIVLGPGATFDVSGLGSNFGLGSAQTLSNRAPTACLNGNINAGPGTVSLTYAPGMPSLIVTNGTLKIANTTVFKVNNTGPALVPGSYKIISRQAGGAVAAAPILPTVSVGGGGIASGAKAALHINNGELDLLVTTTGATP